MANREGWRNYQGRWHYFKGLASLCTAVRARQLNRGVKSVPPTTLSRAMAAKQPACKDCLAVKRQPQPVPLKPTGQTAATTPASTAVEPELTEALALTFVKLLHAGLPGPEAAWVTAPAYVRTLDVAGVTELLRRWGKSPACTAAAATLNRGAWPDLDADTRLRIALDKHYAELGYWLYTTDWSTADARRAADAREALAKKLEGRDEADDTPMMAFLRAVQSGELRFDKPAQLAGLGDKPKLVPLDPTPRVKGES